MIDRARIWNGDVVYTRASAAALVNAALSHVRAAFDDDLRTLHLRWLPAASWERTCAARRALADDTHAHAAAAELALTLGFARSTLAFDRPRLRVVEPGAHRRVTARRAFYAHRDTWYGSPRAQVNVWIPLFDVDERDSFATYPEAFGKAVDNDSASFDYGAFTQGGGFQSQEMLATTYPRCLGAPPGEPVRVRARAGEVVAFSPAHLHATTPNETVLTRFSVDVRFVDVDDVSRHAGAPDPDNRARGSALVDYLRPP
jgi:hypothetical protein